MEVPHNLSRRAIHKKPRKAGFFLWMVVWGSDENSQFDKIAGRPLSCIPALRDTSPIQRITRGIVSRYGDLDLVGLSGLVTKGPVYNERSLDIVSPPESL